MQEVKTFFTSELEHIEGMIETITEMVTQLQAKWKEAAKGERRDLGRALTALASGLQSAWERRNDIAEIIRALETSV